MRKCGATNVRFQGGSRYSAEKIDTGKTTIARNLAEQFSLQLYEYDCYDVPSRRLLTETHPEMKSDRP